MPNVHRAFKTNGTIIFSIGPNSKTAKIDNNFTKGHF